MGANTWKDFIFQKIHNGQLVYNTCWEDPRADRALLNLQSDSRMVMITSAGCNALDYALDSPAQIHCIDMNPRQNALLELKIALLKTTDFQTLFNFFGIGKVSEATHIFNETIAPALPAFAKDYWARNLFFFNGKGMRRSFYWHGTSGVFAWLMGRFMEANPSVARRVRQMFEAETLEKQQNAYFDIEPKILNSIMRWLLNRHLTMCLLGVPESQQKLFMQKYNDGALGFIRECFRKIFTQISIQDNYFYHLYFYGNYSVTCSPEYLRPQNFTPLSKQVEHIKTHTNTLSQFLKDNPSDYSHYVLLDHQDWLAANNRPALQEEWELILKNSRVGTKILMRSAAHEIEFLPDFVREKVGFNNHLTDATLQRWHHADRVGTYASVYLGVVK
jgi:S-adenosylmethionine-diacylglycerol 3-amino-3-carboxypropyl transferase